jgi:hypothetical protein
MELGDDEIVYFEKLNLLNIRIQSKVNSYETRLLLEHQGLKGVAEIENGSNEKKEREKNKIKLIIKFIDENNFMQIKPKDIFDQYG